MPVRVCHISTVHPATDVRIFHRDCCTLAQAGYDVHLVIPAEESTVRNGVHIHAIPRARGRLRRMLIMPWVAMRAALRTRAEICHFHDPEILPAGFVLRWVFGKRVVYDIHENVPQHVMSKEWLPPWSRGLVSTAYRLIERVLARGSALVLASECCLPRHKPPAYLVRNYPVLHEPAGPAVARTQPPLLVYVGRISELRGGMVYVNLARELVRRGHSFRMMLVGPYDPEYGQRVLRAIEEMQLTEHVQLTGPIDNPQAMELVAQATIAMCLLLPDPNYVVCLPTKILEYMMLGTPVLASDFDYWRPYVLGERVGLAADPCNLEAVVAACERLLADPAELEAMGRRGAATVQDRFNWASEFATLRRCYDDQLYGRKPPTS